MMDMRINMIKITTKQAIMTLHREGRPDSGDFYLKLMRLKAEQEEHLKLVSLDEKENACRKSPPSPSLSPHMGIALSAPWL